MDPVKIGFVGVGSMGQAAHLRNYVTIPECQVVAMAEVRPHLREQVAARYAIPHSYASAEEMLASETLDGIVASQPFTRHGTLVPQLLKAGVPIFTEKPLAGSVEAGERILEALQQSGTWHMVGYHKRSDPATMYAMEEIRRLRQTGELGKLRYVRILMPAGDWVANGFRDMLRSDDPNPGFTFDPPASDMDAETYREYIELVNYYIHQINLMRYLLGAPYRVTFGDKARVMMAVESTEGVTGVIEMSPYQTTRDWQESALVAFEKGYVRIDLVAPLAYNRPGRVEILRDPGNGATPETVVPTLPWVHAMRQQAINFVTAVRGEGKPPCEAAEALEDLRVAREYIRLIKGC